MRNVTILCVALGLALAGCGGSSRSVAAYCSYFYGEGSVLRRQFSEAENFRQDPIGALGTILESPRDLSNFFHQLSLRAPESIANDVQTLADAFAQEANQEGEDATDPLAGLASGLVNGLSAAPAEERVDAYTRAHCGPPPKS